MSTAKAELYPIVADLRAMGYGASDIARAVGRTPERIRQVLHDLGMSRPRLRTIDDLPHDIRQRIIAIRNLHIANESA